MSEPSPGRRGRAESGSRRRLHVGVTPWPVSGDNGLSEVVRQARLAEELGFDSFFLPESHLHPGARPAPLIALAAIAGATEAIRLGTTSLLLPLRDPLLLAEEIATLDHLSAGRLILGLGRGFRPATLAAFGVDPRSKRDRFEQVLATMLRAWGVEPRWEGAPGPPPDGVTRVEPSPRQRPHPPLWVAAFGPKAVAQAARLGLPYLASPMEPVPAIADNLARHRAASPSPRPLATVPVMRTVFVSEDASALRRAAEALQSERESLATSRRLAKIGGEGRAEDRGEDVILLGASHEVERALQTLVDRLGVTHVIARSPPSMAASEIEPSLRSFRTVAERCAPPTR